ncbi:MAG: hypothetical protein VX639_10835, partial [Pseudomonadota bacterium]|nr:hypothetical protein [Pseudomonadota bacterium]
AQLGLLCPVSESRQCVLLAALAAAEWARTGNPPSLPQAQVVALDARIFTWHAAYDAASVLGEPAALINAVIDALNPLGVTNIDMPATPQKVWQAIQDAAA